ncbi:DUF3089 domain-containing protein [Altererythrobacter aurantiacus]|uniref:DUF3089 domain-containing protein n=1 Tax=Parapontixanthobacter aurantiacus TaxID=1463599 RepID=A0A844ZGI0_9SPHN|nr:DUF3089 domain-containing protein [Parapontixanthobacter aurantiacus]MXO86654.1 DUF3089 domain-containing protein [Parapontixanthobacter aurantiacus]
MKYALASMLMTAGLAMSAHAQQPSAAPAVPVDYANNANWLCLPDRFDACASDQSVTVIEADGASRVEPLVPDADPAFDCFYVYPTVSLDPTPNSDMIAGAEEMSVAHAQAARFRQHCKVYAPLYRQVTLAALRDVMAGKPLTADGAMAYGDVKAAWEHYLANDNEGPGVVLIGHSQGSRMLGQLLNEMTDPAQRDLIISAMPIGYNVERSADGTRGDYPWMPACTSADQAGCVIGYVTFREEMPPPAQTRFGRATGEGMNVLCVNPAALLGHAESANAILAANGISSSSNPQADWVEGEPQPTTNFVSVPGLVGTRCVNENGASYLAMNVNADPADPRTDTIAGDVIVAGQRLPDWGLHLIDMPVVMGDLVALTERQYAAWAEGRSARE